jgi:uncharacterized protein (TIGR02246 family)
MRARTRRLAAFLILAAALPACSAAPTPGNTAPSSDAAAVRRELEQTFTRMADAWNAGDMPGHVAPYADSATMMTGRGPAGGRERIAEMLTRAFWQDGRPLQQLRFEQVLVRPLGADGAVVTGRFILSGGERAEASGWFTTAWERTADGWRIVHDHSG